MIAIKARRMFDGNKVLQDVCILADGERICKVGTAQETDISGADEVRDYGDATLIPGLIDCHVHITGASRREHYTMDENVRKAYRMGIPIAVGSDDGLRPGDFEDAYSELRYLQDIGIDAEGILKMCAINGAKLLELDGDYGTLEKGKKAAFLVLKENPLEDINHLYEEKCVYRDGKVIFSSL